MSENQSNERLDDEQQLRQLLKLGNTEALSLLWDRYADSLFRLLLSILQSPTDAEDVLQDIFLKVSKKRVALSESNNIAAYLYQMARHAGIDAFNKTKKHRQKHAGDESLQYVQSLPGTKKLDAELLSALNSAISALPEEQRSVVILKIYDQQTFYDISEILDISPNTCASRYRYGMEKLRQALKGLWP